MVPPLLQPPGRSLAEVMARIGIAPESVRGLRATGGAALAR